MTDPFLGEVQIFGFPFAPSGWVLCNGTTLPLSQNAALYSLIGTTYGGNGTSTFQVPNLVNRSPCSQGTGPALTQRVIGESFGEGSVSLVTSELPRHNHVVSFQRTATAADKKGTPQAGYGLSGIGHANQFVPSNSPNTTFAPTMVSFAGQNTPHDNHQPYLALNFCLALSGAFPAFN
jgi:microcystin-dependent protein